MEYIFYAYVAATYAIFIGWILFGWDKFLSSLKLDNTKLPLWARDAGIVVAVFLWPLAAVAAIHTLWRRRRNAPHN